MMSRSYQGMEVKGWSLRVRVTGQSMTPFLRGGEILTIKKEPHDALRKGDLIFFKSSHGAPLLHRIIQKRKFADHTIIFRTKGDGLIAFDERVEYHRILGKVSKIEKTNLPGRSKYIDMESRRWRTINSMMAWVSLFRACFYSALRRARGAWGKGRGAKGAKRSLCITDPRGV